MIKLKFQPLIILFLILALGAFFRFYQLDKIPPGLYPDEAINANQAITEPGKVFYPDNNGREGLFINLLWISFAIFGVSFFSFKLVPAFLGTLTILGTYLLTKELFGKERLALLASFFLAISFWHVNFSRIGFRAILLPFILVFAFYFLFKAFKTKRLTEFIIAGIIFGLGFYTYTSFRLAVLLLPLTILYFWNISAQQKLYKKFVISTFAFLFSIFLVALPISIYFILHPTDFASRAAPISIFAQQNPLIAFIESLVKHLAMFNIYGDPNWRHNLSSSPQLLWPVGIIFLFGICLATKKILLQTLAFLKYQKCSNVLKNIRIFLSSPLFRLNDEGAYLFLLSWLFTMLLPGALTYESLPHALRTIGVIPAVYILTAIGGWQLWQALYQKIKHKNLLLFLALSFLFIITLAQFNKYFIAWAKNDEVKNAFTYHYVQIGNYLNSLPDNIKKYVIVNEYGKPLYGISIPAQTPMFIERAKYGYLRAEYIKAEELSKIKENLNKNKKIVIVPLYPESLSTPLKEMFPQITSKKINGIEVFTLDSDRI